MGVPQNGWFIVERTIIMDDLGLPPFQETSKWAMFHNNKSLDGTLRVMTRCVSLQLQKSQSGVAMMTKSKHESFQELAKVQG